jgi:hypothetical protein
MRPCVVRCRLDDGHHRQESLRCALHAASSAVAALRRSPGAPARRAAARARARRTVRSRAPSPCQQGARGLRHAPPTHRKPRPAPPRDAAAAHAPPPGTRFVADAPAAPVSQLVMGSTSPFPPDYAEWVSARGGNRPIRKILIANNGRACPAARGSSRRALRTTATAASGRAPHARHRRSPRSGRREMHPLHAPLGVPDVPSRRRAALRCNGHAGRRRSQCRVRSRARRSSRAGASRAWRGGAARGRVASSAARRVSRRWRAAGLRPLSRGAAVLRLTRFRARAQVHPPG